jgi:hypothetical protein
VLITNHHPSIIHCIIFIFIFSDEIVPNNACQKKKDIQKQLESSIDREFYFSNRVFVYHWSRARAEERGI